MPVGNAARGWVAPSLAGVAAVALSVVGGVASLAMPSPPSVPYKKRRAPIHLPRGAHFPSIAAERQARKETLARELVALLPPQVCEMLLGPDGYAQVPGAVERAEAVARIVLALGGPDGDGLVSAAKAIAVLREHAAAICLPYPFCLPLSALLAHTLIAREQSAGVRISLVSIVRRALTAWMAHWSVSWVSLPPNHASKLLLSEKPHSVAPVVHPWDPKMK